MDNRIDIEFSRMEYFPQDNSPVYSDMQLEKLQTIARSFESGFDNADMFFDVMLEIGVYICLLNLKQRDTVFFEELRQHECICDFMPAAHYAKKFIMNNCRRCIPFFNGSVTDEIDAVLGTLICEFSGRSYSLEKMCEFPDCYEPMDFPDGPLLRNIRQTAQSLFPEWDGDDTAIYTSRPFALFLCLYLRYRSAYGRDRAVSMIYGIDDIFGIKEKENFYDLVHKAITLADSAYGTYNAKWYRPAVVLWHIFRVLRRLSEGFACDEWMTCGCDLMCDSCDARLAPDDDEYDDDEDDTDDEYMNFFNFPVPDDDEDDEDDSDDEEDDLDFVDLNYLEETDSSDWVKDFSDTY